MLLIEASPRVDQASVKTKPFPKHEIFAKPPPSNFDSRMYYSLDRCETFADCEGSRYCRDPDTNRICDGGNRCFCRPFPYENCSTSADCLSNDRCFQDTPTGRCISCDVTDDAYGLEPVDEGNCENDEHGSNVIPGYAFTYCHDDAECVYPRKCQSPSSVGSTFGSCNIFSEWCACRDPTHYKCTTSNDCLENDRCVELNSGPSLCASCAYEAKVLYGTFVDEGNCESFPSAPSQSISAKPSNAPSESSASATSNSPSPTRSSNPEESKSPEESESPKPAETPSVCIAAEDLVDFDGSDLVFAENRRGGVLCDQFDSCATPGHMVEFRGRSMSMKEYCAVDSIHCVKRIKFVNSPKMKMGLRIKSKSKHLMFTALSASKETWLETRILAAILRLGI